MDGFLWLDNTAINHLATIFARLHQLGLKVVLATNNATKSVAVYLEKLKQFDVELEPWQVINSAQAAAHYLKVRYPQGGGVFVIGESGLFNTLRENGFFQSETKPLAVVASMDRNVTYEKLRRATLLIRSGVPFIGTNPDRTFPTPEGLVPGAGAILAAIATASDVEPVIVGKPSPEMYWLALERLHLSPAETLVVGDRLETDIAGAQKINCVTALVLSGVTSYERAMQWEPAPDFIMNDLEQLIDKITAQQIAHEQ
jgi:4-nitrophenyl phosphatase